MLSLQADRNLRMKFDYTIGYVTDFASSLAFFEEASGLKIRFVHEPGYGELEIGSTTYAHP